MRAAQLAAMAVLTLLAVGGASGGMYMPPGGDGAPVWLPDGSVVFEGLNVGVVKPDGSDLHVVAAGAGWWATAAPTAPLLALTGYDTTGKQWLEVAATDGSQTRKLVEGGLPVGWLPDSSRLIFTIVPVLGSRYASRYYSIRPDGTDMTPYPANVRGTPSPDGSRFAYITADTNGENTKLHVVSADGSSDVVLHSGSPAAADEPLFWSSDGARLAYWTQGVVLTVTGLAGGTRLYPIVGAVGNGSIAWAPDGDTIYADSTLGLVRIDLATGDERTIRGITPPSGVAVSRDGAHIAYSAGGECRDRLGIYVANADGTDRRRVSNSCRIYGTDGPDVLHGDFSQVVLGLGGDDTLYADDTYYYFDGDTLYGGPGNDHLIGGYARDILYGGPGDDTLEGGPSADILIAGPGHDHIDGGGGGDTIGAQDGERDWIDCGGNGYGPAGRDVVYADRIDVVSADCEIVHRR
jgi:Tol biopolymer transport system component